MIFDICTAHVYNSNSRSKTEDKYNKVRDIDMLETLSHKNQQNYSRSTHICTTAAEYAHQ